MYIYMHTKKERENGSLDYRAFVIHTHTDKYIYTERERERERIYIYIYLLRDLGLEGDRMSLQALDRQWYRLHEVGL